MKFKVLIVLFAVFVISSFATIITSCGIIDDEEGSNVDCNKVCNKEKECDKEMTDSDVKECVDSCKKMSESGYYQDSFEKSVNSCYEKACSDIESCITKSAESCKAPDYMPYVNAACDKMIECGAEGTKEECVAGGKEALEKEIKEGSMLKCATDKVFTDLASCMKKANCSTI
ncbi:MAG: hypothetical protein N3B13_08480, partial [Deltaproteobacteria bacterium]|nr:hypothetical protein [Deltaproteobacteria bacterium]